MNKIEISPFMNKIELGQAVRAQMEQEGFLRLDQRLHHEDTINDRLVFLPAFHKAVSSVLERNLDREKLENGLEVGCGTGFFSRYLAPAWLKERLISFDINRLSLQTLKEKDNVSVFQGTVYELPVKSESMDAVIGYSSFDSVTWLSQALSEAKRVLKPNGKLILFQDILTELYEEDDHSREDKIASFERYHQVLIKRVKEAGVEIIEGERDSLQEWYVEPVSCVRQRVLDFELPDRTFPLFAIWHKGAFHPAANTRSREEALISKEEVIKKTDEVCEGMWKEGKFEEFGAKAGDILTIVTMRFLVGKKPIIPQS